MKTLGGSVQSNVQGFQNNFAKLKTAFFDNAIIDVQLQVFRVLDVVTNIGKDRFLARLATRGDPC